MDGSFDTAAEAVQAGANAGAPLFLKTSVKLEPLIERWYAWTHLLSPVQYALNLAFRQLPLLESFERNVSVHVAVKNQAEMFCGPYLQLDENDVPFVRALALDIKSRHADRLTFATDLRGLAQTLQVSARGQALDAFYDLLPVSLKGLVEFAYDTSGRPGFRLFEELLSGNAFAEPLCEEISIIEERDDERSFFLNTPRPRSSSRLDLAMSFDDERIDVLSRLRCEPSPLAEITRALQLNNQTLSRLMSYLTPISPEKASSPQRAAQDGLTIKYFGHACLLVETSKVSILFDPVLAFDPSEGATLTFADLPAHIDLVVLTHNHQDHFSPEILLQLRQRIGRIVVPRSNSGSPADPSMKLALQALGFKVISDLDPLDSIEFPGGRLTAFPFMGEHADLDIRSKHGLLLEANGLKLMFLADSACLDAYVYRRITALLGRADVLFIGMECAGAPLTWLYGPYLGHTPTRREDEGRRLSGSDALRAAAIVRETGCRTVFVYAMGQEPWLRHLLGLEYTPDSYQIQQSDLFVTECNANGIPARRLKGCEILHSQQL